MTDRETAGGATVILEDAAPRPIGAKEATIGERQRIREIVGGEPYDYFPR